ncbi:MAG TPA: hypothetical protein ENI85_11185 [Deltaproteobacteria bacterium]|nr:hypothetical protein [Deltaproteobacteria bacterium]
MSIKTRSGLLLLTLVMPLAFATTASAQAGLACSGTTCGLGGQFRGQIGDGLPLPISIAPAQTGAFSGITIQTAPATPNGLPLVGLGLGQPGQVKPTPMATIMQTTVMAQNRSLTLMAGVAGYDLPTVQSIGVFGFNPAVLAVQTDLDFDNPHPGTTGGTAMNVVPGVPTTVMYSVGGRPGPPIVSFYAGATANGNLSTNYGATAVVTPMAGDPAGINGVARFTATANQFGGISRGRTLGTAMVYFPDNAAFVAPCTGCNFKLSIVDPGTIGVAGGPFGGVVSNLAFMTPTGLFSGTVGFNGTIVNVNGPVTPPSPFTGQDAISVGFPNTTGRLTISVTSVAVGADTEMFKRTGIDARDANGNGVVALVSGSMSARNISKGNANRTWATLEIPEPGAIAAASAGLFALFGCHQLVRRRSRR